MHRRFVAFALILVSLAGAACTFPDPEIESAIPDARADRASDAGPSDTGAFDVGPGLDGDQGRDNGCTPPASCYAQAGSCAAGCMTKESSCANQLGCSLEPDCIPDCMDAETSCKTECAAACTLCTADGGCIDVSGCGTASN